MRLGAEYLGGGRCRFKVWAPFARSVEVRLVSQDDALLPLAADERGYWRGEAAGVAPGARYLYVLDGRRERPDPASTHQPEGVHGPSAVCDLGSFAWDERKFFAPRLAEMIIYELHVGTFTREGTFAAAALRLDYLVDLGVNAIEIMPVAQFPGERNWGYDGCYPFATQSSYGGHLGLMGLVNEAHRRGVAVILDVVYNHLGPEGNYLQEYGPYFTSRYQTPWGSAVNFDGPFSDEVRAFFIENALRWFSDFRLDALRLDAVHGIYDLSARPFLRELAESTRELEGRLGRRLLLIAESDLNDPRVVRSPEQGGYGLDAQWSDDFHHALHAVLTRESRGYYQDFGRVEQLARAARETFVYAWDYSAHRRRRHGAPALDLPPGRFVVFDQNHDQVGNRADGSRLTTLVPFEAQKIAAGLTLLWPAVPLLFMGEEYAEEAPFLYFVSHESLSLLQAVREGRRREFASFGFEQVPAPEAEETFRRSKLRWSEAGGARHARMLEYYRTLIRLRRSHPKLWEVDREEIAAWSSEEDQVLGVAIQRNGLGLFVAANFDGTGRALGLAPLHGSGWRRVLDSGEERFGGPGGSLADGLEPGGELGLPARTLAVYLRGG